MGRRDVDVQTCFLLTTDLTRCIRAVTSRSPAAAHHGFCDQARAAAATASRHVAEGLTRCEQWELAQLLKLGLGSVQETRHIIDEGFDRGLVTALERDEAVRLVRRAIASIVAALLALSGDKGRGSRDRIV